MSANIYVNPVKAAVAWTLLIIVIMLIPGNVIPRIPQWSDMLGWDKLVHLLLFAMEAFLLANAFKLRTRLQNLPVELTGLLAFLTGTIFGCILELLQANLDIGRSGNITDAVAGAIGSFLGWMFFRYNARRTK